LFRLLPRNKPAAALLSALLCALPAAAQTSAAAQNTATGTVTGRVSNAATQKYLASAEVVDRDSGRRAHTDADGSFILVLPGGARTLTVNYGGLDSQTVAVTVAAGATVTQDIALTSADYASPVRGEGEIVRLEAFVVVSGEREGRMASIAQQKAADVMVSVISSDEFPNVAGANLGDFLSNIPGIDIGYSGSDPRDLIIRGMDSQMSGVTSDGLRMANAAGTDGNTRAFNLDQISIQNYETIEVYKTPTASMSADSGAGSVNLVSKSAFNLKQRRIRFQAGGSMNGNNAHFGRYAGSSGDYQRVRPVGNFEYANSFFNNRLGVVFTANYNDIHSTTRTANDSRRSLSEAGQAYHPIGPDAGIYSRSMNYSHNTGILRRTSFSLNFDYKLTPHIKLYANSQINTSYINSGAQSLNVDNVDPSSSAIAGGTVTGLVPDHWIVNELGYQIPVWSPYSVTAVTGSNDIRANTIQDAANSKSGAGARTGLEILNKIGHGTMFSLGGEYKRGGWKINLDAGVSLSTNHYTTPDGMALSLAEMYLRGIDYRIDHAPGSDYPILTQLNGPDLHDLANYVSRAVGGTNGPKVNIAGTNRNVPDSSGDTIMLPGLSTDRTYPLVQRARGDYGPFKVSNGRWLSTKDKFTTAKFDARRDFFTRIPMYAQIGGLYREQARHADRNGQTRWFFNGTTEELRQVLEAVKSPDLDAAFGPYQPVPYFSLPYIDEYFRAHPEKFTEDVVWRTETERVNDKFSRERVTGGYGMFNIKLGRFGALLGLRYEGTSQYGEAYIADHDAVGLRAAEMLLAHVQGYGYANNTAAYNDLGMNPVTGMSGRELVANYTVSLEQALELVRLQYANLSVIEKTYADWFPNVQLKYNITANLLARASYNKSIARQPFDRILPGYTVRANSDGTTRDIQMNNPSLLPVYFDNYDVAVELYTKQGGSVSLGYYYKDVENYTANTLETITADGVYEYDFSGYEGVVLAHPVNVGGARHWGVEASVSQRLGILHERLKNFQIYAAYTYQEGKASTGFNSTTELERGVTPGYAPINRLVPRKFKVNLNYRHRRLTASLSYNWQGRYVYNGYYYMGADRVYLWRDKRAVIDASASYALYKNYSLYAEAKNLANEPVREYYHYRKWVQTYNDYGTVIYFGIKGSF
jgi:TonB-dependent receptor